MTYVIAQPCVDLKDRACVEECPVDCIYEGKRMLYIHPDECVDCGACEPVCPVEAIFYEDDTPEEWKDYYKANVEFFDDLGSPGGAAKMGVIDKDHPLIAALPPQEHAERPRRRSRADERARAVPRTRSAARRRASRLPLGHARRRQGDGDRAPGRDRRPLDRHAGRPDARTWSSRRWPPAPTAPGYPLTSGTAGAAGGARRLPGAAAGAPRSTRTRVLPLIGSKELVAWLPDAARARPRRRRGLPEAGLPDVRGRARGSPARRPSPATT